MTLTRAKLANQYDKARAAYAECVAERGTQVFQETGFTVDELIAENECVSLKYWGTDDRYFVIETRLTLQSQGGDTVGWYSLQEDERGAVVDDFLVFE